MGFALILLCNQQAKPLFKGTSVYHNTSNVIIVLLHTCGWLLRLLTLRLLMSYIYGAPSKARNANVVYIWTYVWQR